jgi:hypothetical protein
MARRNDMLDDLDVRMAETTDEVLAHVRDELGDEAARDLARLLD